MSTVNKHAEYNTYSFFRDNILGASPGLEDIGNGRGHAMIRSMLMTVSGETLRKILELFREQPEFKDRVKLVMEAYELFWSKWLKLHFWHSNILKVGKMPSVKTEKVDTSTCSFECL